MPIIQHRHVKKSRISFYCDECDYYFGKGSSYHWFYGMAHYGEKPHVLRFCQRCNDKFNSMRESVNEKTYD